VLLELPPVRLLSTARMFTCAVDEQDALVCLGANNHGQLGVGDLERRNMPALVEL
jgi:hypothetical protein